MSDTPGLVTVPFHNTVVFIDPFTIALKYKADAVRVDDVGEICVLVGGKWQVVSQVELEDLSHWKVGGSE